MLLFTTMLDVNEKLTKEAFINLVIEWNNTAKYKANIIPNVAWNGEDSIRYGNEKLWMDIKVFDDIIAVRYEKIGEGHIIWDTDYVLNTKTKKLAIRLDRSYTDDASISTSNFSTPHFITLLIENGYLKKDGKLSVGREAINVTEAVLPGVAGIINKKVKVKLPIVLVSKTKANENPVDVGLLASRLKGVAHVLVLSDKKLSRILKLQYKLNLETNGDIGIYFPEETIKHRSYPYRRNFDIDARLLERVVHIVVRYSVAHNFKPLYTWQGVSNAILARNVEVQRIERMTAEKILTADKDEAYKLLDAFDDDMNKLQKQVEELSRANEVLSIENQGLRNKLSGNDNEPVLYLGDEEELFPGEIKDILLATINEALDKLPKDRRRYHVLNDILESNEYKDLLGERQKEVKSIFKGYKLINGTMKQRLMDLGFEITDDGKHYKMTYFGDSRYMATVAKTPSDNRSGSNIASVICRDMM